MVALDPKQLSRLAESVYDSYRAMDNFRGERKKCVRGFCGEHYPKDKTDDQGPVERTPIFLMELAVGIYRRAIAPQLPRAMVTSRVQALKADAEDLGLAINFLAEEIDLSDTFIRWVTNALFGVGILNIGICTYGGPIEVDGFLHDYTQPYADVIDDEDFVIDMRARRWDKIQYAGHKKDVPLEWAKKQWPESAARLSVDEAEANKNPDGTDRASNLSRGAATIHEFEETIEVWEIWLPQQGMIVTMLDRDLRDSSTIKPLSERPYEGPEEGPYAFLWFEEVPSQLLPLPPTWLMRDLHEMVNKLYSKLGRQALRQKQLNVYSKNEDDARTIQGAKDGDYIGVAMPEDFNKIDPGGPNQVNFAFVLDAIGQFNVLNGNLQSLGGLGAQTETATQDKLIAQAANERLNEMQVRVTRGAQQVFKQLAFWLYSDPLIQLPLTKRIPGTSIDVDFVWGPERREADFLEYNFVIEPYSQTFQTPQSKLANAQNLLTNFVMPMQPFMQEQGVGIDFQNMLRDFGRMLGVDGLENWFTFSEPSSQEQRGPIGKNPREAMARPANTSRTYERVSRSNGPSPDGQRKNMMTALMSGAMDTQGAGA